MRYLNLNSSKHPAYNSYTLFYHDRKGLAVIRQYYNSRLKITWWGALDDELAEKIAKNEAFYRYFERLAGGSDENEVYPTVTLRQVMRGIGIKAPKKQLWETRF